MSGIRRYRVINVILLLQIEMEEHRRHHRKQYHHFPAFAGNSVSGSRYTLDYIRVRSGCSCEIMPKPRKKKIAATKARRAKSKHRQQRDQELETWKSIRVLMTIHYTCNCVTDSGGYTWTNARHRRQGYMHEEYQCWSDNRTQWKRYQQLYHRFSDDN